MTTFLTRSVRAAVVFALAARAAVVFAQTPPAAVSAPPPAAQVLSIAARTAKATNKSILVHFGASW